MEIALFALICLVNIHLYIHLKMRDSDINIPALRAGLCFIKRPTALTFKLASISLMRRMGPARATMIFHNGEGFQT